MKEYLSFNVKQQAFHVSPYPSHQGNSKIPPSKYGWFDIEKIDTDLASEFINYLEEIKNYPEQHLTKVLVLEYFQEFNKIKEIYNLK